MVKAVYVDAVKREQDEVPLFVELDERRSLGDAFAWYEGLSERQQGEAEISSLIQISELVVSSRVRGQALAHQMMLEAVGAAPFMVIEGGCGRPAGLRLPEPV